MLGSVGASHTRVPLERAEQILYHVSCGQRFGKWYLRELCHTGVHYIVCTCLALMDSSVHVLHIVWYIKCDTYSVVHIIKGGQY